MVIVEFCSYGDLQSYLRHCRGVEDKYYQDLYKVPIEKLGSRDLLSFAIQTARGMAHLAGMKVKTILIWKNCIYFSKKHLLCALDGKRKWGLLLWQIHQILIRLALLLSFPIRRGLLWVTGYFYFLFLLFLFLMAYSAEASAKERGTLVIWMWEGQTRIFMSL